MMVRNSSRFLTPSLARLLLELSHGLRYDNLHKMLHTARLAVDIAVRLSSEDTAEDQRLSDLRATCYTQLSHALRVSGDFKAAEEAASTANACLHRGTGNPMARALVYECLGALRTAQFRFHEAVHVCAAAVEVYRALGRADALGRALVGQAIAVGESGAPEEALELLFESIPKVEGNPQLTLVACHAVVRCLIDAGRVDEAACRWIELRTLYARLAEPKLQIWAAWLEGLLLKAQGRHPAALKMFESARAGHLQSGSSYNAALVSLDMAGCYLQLGRIQQVRQALSEVVDMAQEHDIDRQRLLAFIALRYASEGHLVSS
jgi:tetratricopeptide (TPR) repeat protein